MPSSATVFDPHAYKAASSAKAAPCKVCGSGKDAYVHSDEAAATGYTLVVRQVAATDAGKGTDKSG